MGNEVGQRNEPQQQTDAYAEGQTGDPADQSDDRGFDQELAFDIDGGCAERFANADFARALGDGDKHDVHDADAAESESQQRDGSEEEGHHAEDALGKLRSFERVPYPERFFVVGIVVVALGDDSFDLSDGLFVQIGRDRLDDDVVDEAAHDAGTLGRREVPRHCGVGCKELSVVRAASIAAILLLFGEHADDGVLIAGDHEGLSDDALPGKSCRFASAPRMMTRAPSASSCSLIRRPCSTVRERNRWYCGHTPRTAAAGRIPLADFGDGAAQLGAYGFDQRGLLLDCDGVVDREANVAAGGVSACLCAGLSAEEDGDVGADAAQMLLLIHVEADAETYQQNDGGDAPHDSEHRQKAAKLRFPERGQRLLENLVERHRRN